jgi:hypothetical protein
VASPTSLTFVTPPHAAGEVDLVVTTPTGASEPAPFTYRDEGPDDDGSGSGGGSGDGGSDGGSDDGGATSGEEAEGVLAYTGADVRTQALGGTALLAAGVLLLLSTRRRSTHRQR